jgi:hypothetical protein
MKKIQIKLKKSIKKTKLKKPAYLKYFLQKYKNIARDIKKSLNAGALNPQQARIVVLTGLIVFAGYFVMVKQYYYQNFLQVSQIEQKSLQKLKTERFEKELSVLVAGYPIEAMIPYIASKDRKTAAYLIGIAKKESNWGKRKPVLDGEDCYNYWGFRAKSDRMGSGGHTCFDNPKEAVTTVSKRIDQIIERNDVKSAKNMIVWKCGSNCAVTGGQDAADKWIKDVDIYAGKVLTKTY